jgi:hypothetical protein
VISGGGPLKLYFDDVSFDGQLQRSVGKADCADVVIVPT